MSSKQSLPVKTAGNVITWLDTNEEKIDNVLKDKDFSVHELRRSVSLTLRDNPKLLECTKHSFFGSVMESVLCGLRLSSTFGEAAVIPFGRKAQFVPMYKGLIKLAMQGGVVTKIYAHIAYEEDEYEVHYGSDKKLKHVPLLDGSDRGKRLGVYAVYHTIHGASDFVWVPAVEVEALRDKQLGRCYNRKQSPWYTNEDAMWRKTAIRRLNTMPVNANPAAARAMYVAGKVDASLDTNPFEDGALNVEHFAMETNGLGDDSAKEQDKMTQLFDCLKKAGIPRGKFHKVCVCDNVDTSNMQTDGAIDKYLALAESGDLEAYVRDTLQEADND